MKTPNQLSPRLAVQERKNLKNLVQYLANAYSSTKQLYLAHFPDGGRPYCAETYRSDEVQARYYAQGRSTPGPIITWKRPGESKHNRLPAEAFDVWFIDEQGQPHWDAEKFQRFKTLLLENYPLAHWGGSWLKFKDIDHFEL